MGKDTNNKIQIGDKFKAPDGSIREVVGLKPGGKVEMIIRDKNILVDRWHKDVKKWDKVNC